MTMRFVIAAVAALAAFVATSAAAETCMKTGEQSGAMGTVCYYRCSFGETTENIGPAKLCPLTSQASATAISRTVPSQRAGTCMKSGERTTGMSKQCIYDCAGTTKVETVGAAQLCPLTAR